MARATFRLATGKWEGPLFGKEALESFREDWFQMLPDPVRARLGLMPFGEIISASCRSISGNMGERTVDCGHELRSIFHIH